MIFEDSDSIRCTEYAERWRRILSIEGPKAIQIKTQSKQIDSRSKQRTHSISIRLFQYMYSVYEILTNVTQLVGHAYCNACATDPNPSTCHSNYEVIYIKTTKTTKKPK